MVATLPLTVDLIPKLIFGDGDAVPSFAGLRNFATRTMELIDVQAAASRCDAPDFASIEGCVCPGGLRCVQGSAARETGKVAFAALVRENMWIPTVGVVLYVLFVFCAPAIMKDKNPLPLKHVSSSFPGRAVAATRSC